MTTSSKSIFFLFLICIFTNCTQTKEPFNFISKWQSLNKNDFIIEIDEQNNYTLFRNEKSPFKDIAEFEKLKINITKKTDNWNTFVIEDEKSKKEFVKGRIEIVNKDRIRIYFHKHHDILDLADEFYRTEDFSSYQNILKEIWQQPES